MIIQPKAGQKLRLDKSEHVYKLLKGLIAKFDPIDQDKEHFFVIGVTRALNLKYIDWVSMGTLHATVIEPREVFRTAILHAASTIILGHNHPSGLKEPSKMDISTTKQLCDAGRLIRIKVIDHVIIGQGGYYSFADNGKV